jgi:hypothetical protein
MMTSVPLALAGYDVIACATARGPCTAIGNATFATQYQSLDKDGTPRFNSEFRFLTQDNVITFENAPFLAAPRYGGFCAWTLANNSSGWGRYKMGPSVDLVHSWRSIEADGMTATYLFESEAAAISFVEGLPVTKRRADAAWAGWWGVHGRLPPFAIHGGPFNSVCFNHGAAPRACSTAPQPIPLRPDGPGSAPDVPLRLPAPPDACSISDESLERLRDILCVSLQGAAACSAPNVTAEYDWPSQVVYMHDLLLAIVGPSSSCLNTTRARAVISWLGVIDPAVSAWWWTWLVFQPQYYDTPRNPGVSDNHTPSPVGCTTYWATHCPISGVVSVAQLRL